MLPKINRLKSEKDFRNVFKNGKTAENQFFRVKILKNQKNISRFGFIISNKVLREAVLRNVLKRRLRAVCRVLIKELKTGFDITVWPKSTSAALKHEDLIKYLGDLIIK